MKKLLLTLIVAYICQSCIFAAGPIAKSAAKKNLTVEKKAIPTDLGKDDSYVVCILEERNSRDKYLKKYFTENYKGNYVFATRAQAASEYSDVNKYRYLFTYEKISGNVHHMSDNSNTPVSASNYYIYDRKTNTEYNSKFHSSFFGKMLDAYTTNMEKQRLSNQ